MRVLIILHLMYVYMKTCGDVKLGKYGSNQEAATFGSSLMRLFAKMEVLGYRTNTDTRGIGNSTQEHSEKMARGRTKKDLQIS